MTKEKQTGKREAVKISILVRAYNEERYIDQCLKSLMAQTFRDLEIIVVDDASTDGTLSRIEAAAAKDAHIRILRNRTNLSMARGTEDAVRLSRGKYVMFVDSDDWLEPDACERLWAGAEEAGVDLLHFGMFAENFGNHSPSAIEDLERACRPYMGSPLKEPLVTACFEKKLFTWTIWNKIYRGELLRSVFSEERDIYFNMDSDVYALFFILLRSKTYRGIEDRLYHYAFGRGMTGRKDLSLDQFSDLCQGARVWRALDQYVSALEHGKPEDSLPLAAARTAVDCIRLNAIRYQTGLLLSEVNRQDQPRAFLAMESEWNMEGSDFIRMLADTAWERSPEFFEILARAKCIQMPENMADELSLFHSVSVKNLAESRDLVIEDLRNWTKELEKAKEWFLGQIENKDRRIKELEEENAAYVHFLDQTWFGRFLRRVLVFFRKA